MSTGKLLPTFRMKGVLVLSGSRNEKNENNISKNFTRMSKLGSFLLQPHICVVCEAYVGGFDCSLLCVRARARACVCNCLTIL